MPSGYRLAFKTLPKGLSTTNKVPWHHVEKVLNVCVLSICNEGMFSMS